MKNPTTAPWNLAISRSDVEKLQRGFKPAAMEDRWKSHADAPDARGGFVVHVHRSWTGDEVFRMNVVVLAAIPDDGDVAPGEDADEPYARIADITWDRGDGVFLDTEGKAKDLAAGVCRGVMGCEF